MQNETAQLKDYLRGMKRGNGKALAQLTAINNWPQVCQRELERRANTVVQMFSDEILMCLISGEIDLREVIADVLAEKS